tara:strand:+ start:1267 stop:1395 length:129 start_codon:yes stop_codon:yes gene_type:complete
MSSKFFGNKSTDKTKTKVKTSNKGNSKSKGTNLGVQKSSRGK